MSTSVLKASVFKVCILAVPIASASPVFVVAISFLLRRFELFLDVRHCDLDQSFVL